MKRTLVCTDIRGIFEPDDSYSLTHLLAFQHLLDLVGFVITRPAGRLSSYKEIVEAFNKDKQRFGFPFPPDFKTDHKIHIGATKLAPSKGYDKPTAGSKFIIRQARLGLLHVCCWGSCNDVAQAVHDDPSIIPNLRVFLGGVGGYNYDQDPAPYEYLRDIPSLHSIWTQDAGRGLNVGPSTGIFSPKDYVDTVLKPCGKVGKLLAAYAPYTTYRGLKWGDSISILFLLTGDWDHPEAGSWGGKYKRLKGTKHYVDVEDASDYVAREKALKQWKKRLEELYGKVLE